ncbi:MAG: ABC transporter ATP-binding protein [Clostridia bacterium]|nr:ABC transporter ATP-binding protein [Clostridia bacterium]
MPRPPMHRLMQKDKNAPKITKGRALKNTFWMFGRIRKYVPGFIFMVVLNGIISGINGAVEMLYVKALYDFIGQNISFETVLRLIAIYTLYRTFWYFYNTWFWQVYWTIAQEKLHIALHSDMFRKAVSLDLARYDDPKFYNDFIWSMDQAFPHAVNMMKDTSTLVFRVVSAVAISGILFTVDPIMAVIIATFAILRAFISTKYNKVNYEYFDASNPLWRKEGYIRRVFMLPDYAKELRATRVGENLYEDYVKTTDEKNKIVDKFKVRRSIYGVLSHTVMLFGETGLFIFVLYKVVTGATSLGTFSVAMGAIWRLSWTMRDLVVELQLLHEHAIFLEKVRKFTECKPEIVGGTLAAEPFEKLEIKGVSFAYNDGDKKALSEVELTINKGEKIAIVGYNGAGKTTLTKLISRLYDPTEGEVLYNGKNLKEYTIDSVRDRIAAVFQDYRMFASTLAENVAGGECAAEDENKVREALESSTFESKLEKLPQGLATQLTREFYDDGTVLSGGEQQKVAIARAFYKDADLIILDEPSSALDPDAEYELNRSIAEYADKKTVIFISHRLSTTRHADRIYMFEEGRLIEVGTHDELISKNGKYAYMFNLQAEKYRKQ